MKYRLYFLLLIASSAWADQLGEGPLQPALNEASESVQSAGSMGAGDVAAFDVVSLVSGKPKSSLPAFRLSSANESDFRAAHNAYRAGDGVKLVRLAKQLKNTPLEVYASYYQLRLNLENADIAMIKSFLSRPEDSPLIDRLRGEWLKVLGKKQQWALFDKEHPRLLEEDTELACYALQSRHHRHDSEALREARRFWFSGKGQPGSCDVLFEAALSAGVISESDVLRRLRLALEAGKVSLARNLAGRLGGKYAELPAALDSASADTDRYLRKLNSDNATESRRIAALFALQRIAKQSPDLAAARWENIETYFWIDERQYFYGWMGYEAARNQDKWALQWFKKAGDTPLNEQQLVWRVRSALRVQDWYEVLGSINAMSAQQQGEASWLYWKARALQKLGKPAEARNLFVLLSGEINYYGQLAGDELAGSPMLSETKATYKPDQQAIDTMLELPAIQRTLALYRMGFYSDALEEWRWVLRNFNDRELLAAAEIARRNEMYDRAIGAADLTVNVHDFSLRYLAPHRDEIQKYISTHNLEEAWVYGLMRQESRFASGAKSGAGAAGLMQIMPATARWLAQKLGLKDYRNTLIHQLDTNFRLGTYYLKIILSQFDGDPVLSLAAYNAGPRRAQEWRGDQTLEGAIYAETIPFEETREYVQKVMSNTVYYARQFNASKRTLKQRMGEVAPKNGDRK